MYITGLRIDLSSELGNVPAAELPREVDVSYERAIGVFAPPQTFRSLFAVPHDLDFEASF
jgi:hypothetical protein